MRSKKVNEAIDILKSDAEWNGNTHCLETLLVYIKELEKYKNIVTEIKKYINNIKYATIKIVNKPKLDYKDEIIWEMDDKKSGVYIEIELDKIEKILKLKEVEKRC